MRKVGAGMVGVLVALWLGQASVTQAETSPEQGVDKARAQDMPRASRLRFRSGPICMCSNGLGEEEIEAAERKRLESIVEPQEGKRR